MNQIAPTTIRLAVALVVLSLAAVGTNAQTVRGTIVDDSTAAPVAGAEVTLLDAEERPVQTVVSDATGGFSLEIGPGEFSFRVVRFGFAPTLTEAFVVPGEVDTYTIRLTVPFSDPVQRGEAYRLTPVIVEGAPAMPRHLQAFERRREVGMGDHVTRAEFGNWNPQDATDIVRRMPSFYVRPNPGFGRPLPGGGIDTRQYVIQVTTMSHRRGNSDFECPPLLYLDGAFVGDSRRFDITHIPIDAIEAVETYSRPAQIPVEFNRAGSNCGVIALWTRSALGNEDPSRFEVGARYGGSVTSSQFGWGRLGIHFVIPLIGPLEFYPAFHLMVDVPAPDDGGSNSGWQAQVAVRGWPASTRVPWYVGGGLVVTKQYRTYGGVSFDKSDPDAAYSFFTGGVLPVKRLRPFVEIQVLDLFTFSDLVLPVYFGIGAAF